MRMTRLQDRRTAAAVMVLMIVLGVLLGAWRSGSRLYARVEDLFYNGEKGNGVGMASDLSQRVDAAVNMILVAKRSIDPADSAVTGLEEAVTAVNAASGLQEKYRADRAMASAMTVLYERLGEAALSDKDAGYRASLYADFTSAAMTMSHDPYNAQAVEYNREITSFPGRLFFALFGYEEAPIFR